MGGAAAKRSERATASHPEIADIRDLLTFRIAMVAAANDRMGQSWLQADFGLTILEWRILGLTQALGPVRFGRLARALLRDKGQLSRQVKALAERGLITARPDRTDQRGTLLATTAKGRKLHDRVLARALERNQVIVSALSLEDSETLFALLDKLQPFMDRRVGQVVEAERLAGKK